MRCFFLMISFLCVQQVIGQTPEAFQYQAVVRDVEGEVIANQAVQFRMSILQGTINGSAIYTELHSTSTNSFGLASLQIGNGTATSGNFSEIEWGSDSHFVQVEIDETGGSNFRIMGTTQLLAVPYALHAKTMDFSLSNVTSFSYPQGLDGDFLESLDTTIYTVPSGKNLYIISRISEVVPDDSSVIYYPQIDVIDLEISIRVDNHFQPIIPENTRIKGLFAGILIDTSPLITPVFIKAGVGFIVPENSKLITLGSNVVPVDGITRFYTGEQIRIIGGGSVINQGNYSDMYGYLINKAN